jgi:predicted nucleic acid-binding protein
MIVVLDTNVVVSAAFWPKSEDRRCLALLARRKCRMAVTERILREYRALTVRIGRQECPDKDPLPFLDWIERVAWLVEPSPLGKRIHRDHREGRDIAPAPVGAQRKINLTNRKTRIAARRRKKPQKRGDF